VAGSWADLIFLCADTIFNRGGGDSQNRKNQSQNRQKWGFTALQGLININKYVIFALYLLPN
jgi:hypothetical protein